MSAARSLATVRWIHGLVFALAVALTMAFFVSLCPVRYPQLLVFPFLFVPTLPFFGMQMTEAALLTSSAIVFSGSMVVLLIGGRHSHFVGLPLGLSAAPLLTATRSALPVVPFVLTVLCLRLLANPQPRSLRSALTFWGGFGIGSSAFYAIISPPHLARVSEIVDAVAAQMPAASAAARLPLEPWFWIVPMLAGLALELGLRPGIAVMARFAKPVIAPLLRALTVVAAAGILVSIGRSRWVEYPLLESVHGPTPPPLGQYVWDVLAGVSTLFRLNRADTLLLNSFWMGFGWLDTMPRPPYSTAIVVGSGLAFAGLWVHLARTAQMWRLARLWIVLSGAALTLASYAVAGHIAKNNIHGRYLLAWYIPMAAIFWMYPAMGAPWWPSRGTGAVVHLRPLLLGATIVLVHSYALYFNLARYF